MSGKVTHFEVHGRDGKRLRDFYAALFGWKIDASNPMQYGLVSAEQSGIGGGISMFADPEGNTIGLLEAGSR